MLKALQAQMAVLLAGITALEAKPDQTETERTELIAKIEEAEALQARIKGLERSAALNTWANSEAGGGVPVAPDPDLVTRAGEPEWTGTRAGTTLVGMVEKTGIPITLDHEGWGLSRKQFEMIQEPSYSKAWWNVCRGKGDVADLKTLAEGADTGGGYLVPADLLMEIVRRDPQPYCWYDLVRVIPTMRDRVQMPKNDYTTDDIYSNPMRTLWTGEGAAPGAVTDITWGQVEIPVWEGTLSTGIPRSLLEDAAIDLSSYLAEELRTSWQLDMSNVMLNGNGVAKPQGVLLNPGGANQPPSVNLGNPATADGISDLVTGLPPQYSRSCFAILNKTDAYKTYAKIKDSANNYIFALRTNIAGGMASAREDLLFGNPMAYDPFMPNTGANNFPIMFGDPRRTYYAALRLGMSIRMQDLPKDPLAYAVARFRIGGATVQPRAMRVGKQA